MVPQMPATDLLASYFTHPVPVAEHAHKIHCEHSTHVYGSYAKTAGKRKQVQLQHVAI